MHGGFPRLLPPLFDTLVPLIDVHPFGRLQQRKDQSRVSLIVLSSGGRDGGVGAVQLVIFSQRRIRPFVARQLEDQDQDGEESERRRKQRIVVEKLDSRISTRVSAKKCNHLMIHRFIRCRCV